MKSARSGGLSECLYVCLTSKQSRSIISLSNLGFEIKMAFNIHLLDHILILRLLKHDIPAAFIHQTCSAKPHSHFMSPEAWHQLKLLFSPPSLLQQLRDQKASYLHARPQPFSLRPSPPQQTTTFPHNMSAEPQNSSSQTLHSANTSPRRLRLTNSCLA